MTIAPTCQRQSQATRAFRRRIPGLKEDLAEEGLQYAVLPTTHLPGQSSRRSVVEDLIMVVSCLPNLKLAPHTAATS